MEVRLEPLWRRGTLVDLAKVAWHSADLLVNSLGFARPPFGDFDSGPCGCATSLPGGEASHELPNGQSVWMLGVTAILA